MNYSKIYDDLIQSAKLRPNIPLLNGYLEKHHIVPRSMGGSNNKDNIVCLTAREHFIAHGLLWRIHKNKKMACAFILMSTNRNGKRYYNSRGFEVARKAMSKVKTGEKGPIHSEESRLKISLYMKNKKRKPLSEEHRQKLRNFNLGRKHSQEAKNKISSANKKRIYEEVYTKERAEKISQSLKGRKHSDEAKRKISEQKMGKKAKPHSEETKRKMREAQRKIALQKKSGQDAHS